MANIKPLPVADIVSAQPPSLREEAPAPNSSPDSPVFNTLEPPVNPPVVLADAKNPMASKINWAGAILTLVGAVQLAQEIHLIDTLIPDEDLRAKVSASVLFFGGVLTIILRTFFTMKPTTLTEVK